MPRSAISAVRAATAGNPPADAASVGARENSLPSAPDQLRKTRSAGPALQANSFRCAITGKVGKIRRQELLSLNGLRARAPARQTRPVFRACARSPLGSKNPVAGMSKVVLLARHRKVVNKLLYRFGTSSFKGLFEQGKETYKVNTIA